MTKLRENTQQMSELNKQAWALRYSNRDEAFKLASEAEKIAIANQDEENKYLAKLTLAQLGFWMMKEGEHLKEVLSAFHYFKNSGIPLGLARASCICASIYEQYGEYDKAMLYALSAVNTIKDINDPDAQAECHTVLAQVYSRIQDYKQAIEEIKIALELRKKLNDEKAIASSLNLLARNYVLDKKYTKGEQYYKESLALRERISDTQGLPWTYIGIASLNDEKGDMELSLEYYLKAEQANTIAEKRLLLLCLLGKGKIFLNLSKSKDALETLLKAEAEAKQQRNIPFLSEASQLLASVYEIMGDTKQALIYFKRFHETNQMLLGQEKTNSLKYQQITFSVEQSEKETEIYRLRNVELKQALTTIDHQNQELEEKNKEMVDSINYAKRLQQAILPPVDQITDVLPESFVVYQPKDIVSGDFYWADKEGDYFFIAAADCTGHGVPGALVSVVCSNALNRVVKEFGLLDPGKILDKVRELVITTFEKNSKEVKDGMDISLCRINKKTNEVCWAGANNPLWYITAGELKEIKADKQPIGKFDHSKSPVFRIGVTHN